MSDSSNTEVAAPTRTGRDLPRRETAIVPKSSIAGRSLVAIIAIMTFLASLTTGAVVLVRSAASDWQADVAREVTVQVRPVAGRNIDADVKAAVDTVRAAAGIAEVRAYTQEESARLLEPWLGRGLVLDDLPVPRLVAVRVAADGRPDWSQLRRVLTEKVPSASLDDHRGWIERMRTMAGTAVMAGLLILLLVLVATILSVTFATRGAMATNRPVIEVLHFIGARNRFIARRFQQHFLLLGLQGGVFGGGAAILVFVVAQGLSSWFIGAPSEDQLAALFGQFSLGPVGYAALGGQILLIAVVTAVTSRFTVNRTLESVE